MIIVASAIVSYHGFNILWEFIKRGDNFFNRFLLPIRVFLQSCIEIVHIGSVVLIMMQLLNISTYIGSEGIITVRKFRKSKHRPMIKLPITEAGVKRQISLCI